ncbi:MAG TPA: SMR family transporter [Burkholderiales bacterium]|jgi:multidrug transporter EmrE-like cation transporter|nr:SMR family transporter [Burkholderiales bacterium]HWP88154.1 SMR family transporter [Burkholderiales bacterium]
MNATSFSLLMTGVLLNAGAQLLLKAGTNSVGVFEFSRDNIVPVGWRLATEPHIVGGLACYVISVVIWVMALSRVEVSVAYPLLSIGYVVNAIAAWYLFGEAVTPMRLAGIGIIIVGVCLVARS